MKIFALLLLALMPATAFAEKILTIPAGAQAGPGFDANAATAAYLATIPNADMAKSDHYFEGGYWLILWDFLCNSAILVLILELGISARMRDWAARFTRFQPLRTIFYWIGFSILSTLVYAPLQVYEGFLRERQYGLMNQSFGAWLGDQATAFALSLVLGGLLVAALFGIVRKLPNSWPAWGAAVTIVFLAISATAGPVFIAPLFNKYTVLQDAKVTGPILRLARANGIPATKVYDMDASKQSKRVSANVSGMMGTERITLNDNLLARCSPQAVLAVMGHEMGHYVLNHVYKTILFVGAFAVLAFFALRKSLEWALRVRGAKWGVTSVGDVAVLPLALLIFSAIGLIYTPISNSWVRTQEIEADMFGLNASREPDGFAEAAILLGEYRKMNPGHWEEVIFFDHPSGRARIYSAMRWKKENQ